VVSVKGPILAILGGIIASVCFPLMNVAHDGENGLGPYSLGLFFAVGIGIATVILNLFFMNLPIQGEAIELTAYFNGRPKSHWLGVLGGILFYIGLSSILVVMRAEGDNVMRPTTMRGLILAAAAIGTLWGLVRWREFEGAEGKVKTLLAIALFLFAVGIAGLTTSAGMPAAG
jgi:glucose uptake protein